MEVNIIGISGTNGSGKDTVGQMLAERHGFLVVSVSDFLRDELKKQGLTIERENLRALSARWRKKYGLGVLIDKAVDEFKKSGSQYKGLVIPSIRNPGEVDEIHRFGGKVIWTDGDPKIRYRRIHSRGRSSEDKKTFVQFVAEEKAEMDYGGRETALHMAAVKNKADIFLENNGNDIEAFKDTAEKALKDRGIGL